MFCQRDDGKLHECVKVDNEKTKLEEMAEALEDHILLDRISALDIVPYNHLPCRTAYKNRYRRVIQDREECAANDVEHVEAFAEVIEFIEHNVVEDILTFKISELHSIYESRVKQTINKTRLKDKIIDHYKNDCEERYDGRFPILVFKKELTALLKSHMQSTVYTCEALAAKEISKCIRSEISSSQNKAFTGRFEDDCQEDSIPPTLKVLVSMLLDGSSLDQLPHDHSQACLTICQLIMFNTKYSVQGNSLTRHSKSTETPLTVYIGLYLHSLTQSKKIVNQLSELGISITYNRVLELQNALPEAVCKQFKVDVINCL